jgi:hypothetical protein
MLAKLLLECCAGRCFGQISKDDCQHEAGLSPEIATPSSNYVAVYFDRASYKLPVKVHAPRTARPARETLSGAIVKTKEQ